MWKLPEKEQVWSAEDVGTGFFAFSPDGNLIASRSGAGGRIDLWSFQKAKLVASFVAVGRTKNNFVAWTPEGYYVATPEAEVLIKGQQGGKDVPTEEFRKVFSRPDVLATALRAKE
jgi:WD40 repeat protein